jgi:hypothetical protein
MSEQVARCLDDAGEHIERLEYAAAVRHMHTALRLMAGQAVPGLSPAPVAAGPTPGERVAADMVSVHGESLMFKDGKMVAYAVASNASFVTRTIARAIDAARAEAAAEATERERVRAANVASDFVTPGTRGLSSWVVAERIAAEIRRGA